MKKFFIIDGNAYIHRAYHALPPLFTSNNQQINAVYGFTKLILKIKNNFKPDFLAVCFDYPAKNFRHSIFKEYKAHRKPLDEALISQMPLARKAVEALSVRSLEIEGFEADDLIATLACKNKEEKIQTVIVTGDKDILQLVEDDLIAVWNDSKDIMYSEKEVEEKFGVKPQALTDVFSLMGDVADNVPGVKGIGEKTAVKLIKEYGDLNSILDNAESIKGNTGKLLQTSKEMALTSKELIKLKCDVDIEYKLEDFIDRPLDEQKARTFFEEYEFRSLLKDKESAVVTSPLEGEGRVRGHFGSNPKGQKPKIVVSFPESIIVDNVEELKKVIKDIEAQGSFGFKTLCSSGDSLKTQIVGLSLFVGDKVYYVPMGHSDFTQVQISFEEFKENFSKILESKEIKKVGYDLKFERNVYRSQNIKIDGLYFDVMLASYCLDSTKSHEMVDMANDIFDGFVISDDSFLGKASKRISFADAAVSDCAKYADSISFCAYKLMEVFEKELKEQKLDKLFFEMEMPLIRVLSDMEIAGIKIDTGFLNKFNEKIVGKIKDIEKKIFEIAGKEFNINSPKQLSQIMFEKLNLPVIKKTKTGYSTDEEVLTELSSYEFPAEILKYRELQKLKSTYIDQIGNYCVYYGDRIHTIFNQSITATGRLSSTEPNLQNIPIKSEYGREFRKAFICEKDKVFISADYSQIDLRVLAHISGDEKLIAAFNAGQDIHSATAREVFDIPKDKELSKDLRDAAKSINFGIVYGMSPFGLSKQLNIPFAQAKTYIDGYLQRYKGVRKWMSDVVNNAKHDGFVSTVSGRLRYMPELKSQNKQVVLAGERMALNTPVQGTSADIIKIAMINIYNEIKLKGYKTLMLLQVHDDLLFEVPKDEIEKITTLIKEKMESALTLKVPLIVTMKQGNNWGDMK